MKNIFKWFLIIAFVTIISFSMSACDDKLEENDEGVITIQSATSLTIHNNSSYEINITVKDSNYTKQSKTIAVKKSAYFSSLTPPVTVTYSPASKVKQDHLLLGGVYFINK